MEEFDEKAKKFEKFIFNQETWVDLGVLALKIAAIVVVAMIVVAIGKMIIRRMFTLKVKTRLRPSERREKTLLKLLENTLAYVVYFSAILAILAEFMNISGLLASAGVLGLAVGFGAQSLVKDIISGFFIIFEDQFSVGDYVEIGTTMGTVEEIGLRTTKISAYGGEIHILPNGSITQVINYSINNSLAIIDVRIGYEVDINRAESLLEEFLTTLPIGYGGLIAKPTLIGVQDLAVSEIVFRVTAETEPVMQWAFARKFRKDLKVFLDKHGIEIPYPKIMTYQGKEGISEDEQ
ncbi:mechanosensitive ion channel family protein [Sporosarcina jiandibaonis]|uniref:mechanosensitive ion channel family protein n=1 Tax=Sporosarcina jiandibaonis TaxID=2715535 RepID=UPI0031B57B17